MADNPRDFNKWVKSVERRLNQAIRSGQSAQAVRLARDVQNIRNEVENIEGGTSPAPAAPIELVTQTRLFIDLAGRHTGEVSVDFPHVIRDVVGESITVDRYELWIRDVTNWDGSDQESEPNWLLQSTGAEPSLSYAPLTPNGNYQIRVRAVARGVPGPYSVTVDVTIEEDTTPPPIPAALDLTSSGATVTASWNSLAETGDPMPGDFAFTEIAYGYQPSPDEVVATLTMTFLNYIFETPPIPDDENYDGTWYFRHRSVDTSGNRSAWSPQTQIVPKKLVDDASIRFELGNIRDRIDQAELDLDAATSRVDGLANEWDEADFPQLKADLEAAEQAVSEAETRLDAAEQGVADSQAGLIDLRDNRLPALDSALDGIESAVADYDLRITNAQDAADQAQATGQHLEGTVLPALDGRLTNNEQALEAAEGTLSETRLGMENLRDVRVPQLQDDLNSGLEDANQWREVGSISAANVRVGNWADMIPDPGFETDWWRRSGSVSVSAEYTRNGVTKGPVAIMSGNSGEWRTQRFKAIPGAKYVLDFEHERSGSGSGLSYELFIGGLESNGEWNGFIGSALRNFANTDWGASSVEFEVPEYRAGLALWEVVFRLNSSEGATVRIVNPTLRRKVDSQLLVDGSISARHIMAESVAGAVGEFLHISADQIDTEDLAAHLATIIELDAGRITSGQIDTSRLNAEQVAAEVANFLTLDALEINVEELAGQIANIVEVTAESIAAGSISTKHLAIGNFDNLWSDDWYGDESAGEYVYQANQLASDGANIVWFSEISPPVPSLWRPASRLHGRRRWIISGTDGIQSIAFRLGPGRGIVVKPGEKYAMQTWVRDMSNNSILAWDIQFYTLEGDQGSGFFDRIRLDLRGEVHSAGNTEGVTHSFEVPDLGWGTMYMVPFLRHGGDDGYTGTGLRSVMEPTIRKMVDGELIVDGSIQARHIIAEEIAGAVGEFLELHAGQITAGTIDTDRLNVSDLAARIANVIQLNASRITTGQLSADRVDIASLFADSGFISTLRSSVIEAIELTAERIITGDLIATGTIDTEHLNVTGSMVAEFAQFLTVESNMIAANAVTADKISFGSLNGALITGLQIQTHTNNRGVKLTSAGIRAFNSSGSETFNVNASNGSVTAVGGSFTGSTFTGGSFTGATFQTDSRWDSNGGAIIRDDGTHGNFVAVDNSGTTTARLGGGRNEIAFLNITGTLRMGSSTAEGGLVPDRSRLRLQGRMPFDDGVARDMFLYGLSNQFQFSSAYGPVNGWSVTYPEPRPFSNSAPIVTASVTDSRRHLSVNTANERSSGFDAIFMPLHAHPNANENFRCRYISVWRG